MPTIDDLYEGPITRFLITGVPIVKNSDNIGEAVKKYDLSSTNRSLFVVDDEGHLVGFLTDKDLVQAVELSPEDSISKLIRSPDIIAVRENSNLAQLLRIMNGVNPSGLTLDIIPVVNQENRPIAIIKRGSLTEQLSEQFAQGAFRSGPL